MSKATTTAERSAEQVRPGTVRVRVRTGQTIRLSATKEARGGEWIVVDSAELEVPCFRSAVETAEEINRPAPAPVAPRQIGPSFDSLRSAAANANAAAKSAHAASDLAEAESTIKRQADEKGMARELLASPASAQDPKQMARELPR
jgi:hypothetical protein